MHIFYFPSCNYDKLPNSQWHRKLVNGNVCTLKQTAWNENDTTGKNESENCFDLRQKNDKKNTLKMRKRVREAKELAKQIMKMNNAIQMNGRAKQAEHLKEFSTRRKKISCRNTAKTFFRSIFLTFYEWI